MLVVAALLSLSIKAWSSPHPSVLVAGLVGTLLVWRFSLARRGSTEEVVEHGGRETERDGHADAGRDRDDSCALDRRGDEEVVRS